MGNPVVIGHGVPLYLHPGPINLRPLQDGGCRPGRESEWCRGRSSETYRRIETRPLSSTASSAYLLALVIIGMASSKSESVESVGALWQSRLGDHAA
jgi:hypothetical protein